MEGLNNNPDKLIEQTNSPQIPGIDTFFICSRKACGKPMTSPKDTVCWHTLDNRPYCVSCARKINHHNPGTPSLVTIPVPMHVWLVNDDEASAEYERGDILEVFPNAIIKQFKTLLDTARHHKRPDLLIIDLSAVAPIIGGSQSPHFYGPICSLHERFSNTPIIINSAVSSYFAEDVRNDVVERCPQAVVHLVDWAKSEPSASFVKILKTFA